MSGERIAITMTHVTVKKMVFKESAIILIKCAVQELTCLIPGYRPLAYSHAAQEPTTVHRDSITVYNQVPIFTPG